jgi:hypothetical protein
MKLSTIAAYPEAYVPLPALGELVAQVAVDEPGEEAVAKEFSGCSGGRPSVTPARRSLSVRCEGTKQSIFLVIRTGGEIDRIDVTTIAAIADAKGPQPVDNECPSFGIE